MVSTNGGISVRTSLLSSAPARTGAPFALTLATAEGALAVAARAPTRQHTRAHGRDDARARASDARLPAAFEGAFVLDAPGGGM